MHRNRILVAAQELIENRFTSNNFLLLDLEMRHLAKPFKRLSF